MRLRRSGFCLSTLPLCAAGACEPYYRRIRAHEMSAGRSPDFASPKASDLVFAALIGGFAGAALAARSNRVAAALSTIGGATLLVGAKAVARAQRRGLENQPLWYRILSTGALVAPLGWLAGKTTSAGSTQIGTAAAIEAQHSTI